MDTCKIATKVKKFSTLIDNLHEHLDLSRFYINIYKMTDPYGRQIPGTCIEIKSYQNIPPMQPYIIHWQERTEYTIELPTFFLKPVERANYPYVYTSSY